MSIEPEIVDFEDENKNQLVEIVNKSGLEQSKAKYILEKFQDYFNMADEWSHKARAIVVTNETQVADMKIARTGRLFLREKRIAIENARKELKEQSLREGKAIDGIANVLKALIIPIEDYLEKQEKFAEFKEQERQAAIKAEVERKMEEDRIAKEKADAEERERIRIENDRLKKEAAERERQLQEERAEAKRKQDEADAAARAEQDRIRREAEERERQIKEEARKQQEEADRKAREEADRIRRENDEKLAKERAERERAEAELKAKKDAEEHARQEEARKIEALKQASDCEKLLKMAADLKAIALPEVQSEESLGILKKVSFLLDQADRLLRLLNKKKQEEDF